MRSSVIAALMMAVSATAADAEFSMVFEWGDIPACNTGRPNVVPSPRFQVADLPAGTTSVRFRMKDLNAPRYNHGGGALKMSRSGIVPAGAFTYKSPCPPGGVHTYEWTATARKGNATLGTAKARRKYPE